MRTFSKLALVAGVAMLSTAANAQLNGRQVNGTINFGANPLNYYDPANGFVPAGFGNAGGQPVTIGGGIEFGFFDGSNRDTADFTDTQLILRDEVFSSALNWTQTFTLFGGDPFSSLNLVSDSFVPGLTYSLNAGTIQINWAGTGAPNDFRAVFDVTAGSGAVPEPATWALMIGGFGLVAGAMRRRRRSSLAYA